MDCYKTSPGEKSIKLRNGVVVVCRVGEHQQWRAHQCSCTSIKCEWEWGIYGINGWDIYDLNV